MLAYIGTALLLIALLLPRFYLHLVGIVGCVFMLIHAINIGDGPFQVCQALFLMANIIGLVKVAFYSKKKLSADEP